MSEQQASDAARVAEIRQREQAATPGPWRTYAHGIDGGVVSGGRGTGEEYDWDEWICGGERHEGYMAPDDPDTQFIAHSRADIPYLLARLDALRSELEATCAREAALVEAGDALVETVADYRYGTGDAPSTLDARATTVIQGWHAARREDA